MNGTEKVAAVEVMEDAYRCRRTETLLFLAKNLKIIDKWYTDTWLESLKIQLFMVTTKQKGVELSNDELEKKKKEHRRILFEEGESEAKTALLTLIRLSSESDWKEDFLGELTALP